MEPLGVPTERSMPDINETLAKASELAPRSEKTLRKVYSEIINELAELLAANETMRSAMSQAIIPGLVRRMDDRRYSPKDPSDHGELWDLLMRESEDISPDYPYPSTRVVEAALGYVGGFELETMILEEGGTNDPLLVSAVTIAMNQRVYGRIFRENRGDRAWSKRFSVAVNYIQDALLRDVIARHPRTVSVVGDVTVPGSVDAGDPITRFVGGGENPHPEVTAMLNPTLMMTTEQQQDRRLRMKLLQALISPPDRMVEGEPVVYQHSIDDVFGNQGIQASSEEQDLETQAALEDVDQEASDLQSSIDLGLSSPPDTLADWEAEQEKLSGQFSALKGKLDEAKRDAKGFSDNIKAEAAKWQRERAELERQITRLNADLAKARRGEPIVAAPRAARDYGKESLGILADAMGWDADLIGFAKRWVELYYLSGARDPIIKRALRKAPGTTKLDKVLPMVLIENTKGGGALVLLRGAPAYDPDEDLQMEHEVLMNMVIKHWKAKGVPANVVPPNLNDYPVVYPALTKKGENLDARILKRIKTLRQQSGTTSASQSAFRAVVSDRRVGRSSRRWKIEVKM